VRLLYSDFSAFTTDQERLISRHQRDQDEALDFVEGSLLMHRNMDTWMSFFPLSDHPRVMSLLTEHKLLYCIKAAKYYDEQTESTVEKVHVRCYRTLHVCWYRTVFEKRKEREILAYVLNYQCPRKKHLKSLFF